MDLFYQLSNLLILCNASSANWLVAQRTVGSQIPLHNSHYAFPAKIMGAPCTYWVFQQFQTGNIIVASLSFIHSAIKIYLMCWGTCIFKLQFQIVRMLARVKIQICLTKIKNWHMVSLLEKKQYFCTSPYINGLITINAILNNGTKILA